MNLRDIKLAKKTAPTEQEIQKQDLQRWANRVQSEAHWAMILRDAPTPASREELERVVGPLLTFRRRFLCTTPDCDSGKPGLWQPTLVLHAPGIDTTAWAPLELFLCENCKLEASLSDFLTDGIWQQVLDQFDPTTPPPVRRLTTLQWDRIN